MMDSIRRGYELKSLFFGRPIRPFHLAVMIATSVLSYSVFIGVIGAEPINTKIEFYEHIYSAHILGWLALTSSVFLFIGWWWIKEWFAEWGLLLATGVWLTRSVYVLISDTDGLLNNTIASALLSLAWAIGAGGAYILERYDHVMRDESE